MKSKSMRLLSAVLIMALALGLPTLMPSAAKAAVPLDVGPRGSIYDDPANGIYVSPTGNDNTANGSIGSPYKSINTALAAASPGDTIILRGGTYCEGVNVRPRKQNITIKSAKGEWAIIDLTVYERNADEDSGVYFDVDSSGCKLQSVEVIGGFYAVCMETKWDWGDPNDRTGASNIVIEDCKLHDSRYDVVKVKPKCDNVTIRYNEIYNSGRAFDGKPRNGEDNAEGIDNVNGDKMLVQNNYIHDIVSNAVYAKGGAMDALIENNLIETAYGAGIMVGFDASPEFFDLTVNPNYYENIRGVVRNNLIIGAGWEGIGLYASKDAQVYNNTLVNVANGGQYHSAIYFGLTFQDWESYAGRPANVNPSIHHNIVCQPSAIVRPMIEIRYADELGGMSALDGNPVMHDNCYYIEGKTAVFSDSRPGRELENAGFSAWKSHIGGESGSLEIDPALGADYLPTNAQCAAMGITASSAPSTPPAPPAATGAPNLDSASEWARDTIDRAYGKGFIPVEIQGDYTNVITRLEFCRMAVKFVEYALGKDIHSILDEKGLSIDPSAFSDTDDEAILAAFALGITNGTVAPTDTAPGLFTPGGNFSRQEAATMLMRVCRVLGMDVENPPPSDFADITEADGWAHGGINFVRANGIMGGTNTAMPVFSPKATYTRQESIATFDRIK